VLELYHKSYHVIILDIATPNSMKCLQRLKDIVGKDIPFHDVNILETEKLIEIFSAYTNKEKVYAVIHFAGTKSIKDSLSDPLKHYNSNVRGSLSLLRAMNKCSIKKFIFSSTAAVYGNLELCYESSPLKPTSPYGRTKMMVEQIVEDVVRSEKDFKAITLRYFNPIVAHPSGLIGEIPNKISLNLMAMILNVATKHLPSLKVFGTDYNTPDGTGVRDFIHVVDLARGHIAALEKLSSTDQNYLVYNLGTGKPVSVLDMVYAFERTSGIEIPIEEKERRAGDVERYSAVPAKAEDELEWKAFLTLEDMCRDTWNWVSKNPNGF